MLFSFPSGNSMSTTSSSSPAAPVNWLPAIILMSTLVAALTAVPLYGYFFPYDAAEWTTFGVMLALCGFSITAGYHRLWAHKAYESPLAVRAFWAFWGACALQNSILIWASGHRRHHRYCDDEDRDPYSIRRGFWFAHMGWMLRNYPSGEVDFSNAADLERDPVVRFQHRHYAALVILTNVGIPVFLGWLNGDILGMLLLAGVLRLVVSHHVTFFINSLCHLWGKQPYTDTNTARDNFMLALVTYGEGYHNFHHFFQSDYRNGVRWWQFDPTKWLIQSLSWVGLARNLRRTPDFKIQEAVVAMQFKRARQRLESASSGLPQIDVLREIIETEYQQFMQTLGEWKQLRMEWYEQKRQAFAEKRQVLQHRFSELKVRSRLREIEFGLKMQQRRLALLMGQLSAPTH